MGDRHMSRSHGPHVSVVGWAAKHSGWNNGPDNDGDDNNNGTPRIYNKPVQKLVGSKIAIVRKVRELLDQLIVAEQEFPSKQIRPPYSGKECLLQSKDWLGKYIAATGFQP